MAGFLSGQGESLRFDDRVGQAAQRLCRLLGSNRESGVASNPDLEIRKTPLYDLHVALGARMVPFACYAMPVQYPAGIIAEHRATRRGAGWAALIWTQRIRPAATNRPRRRRLHKKKGATPRGDERRDRVLQSILN